MSDAPSLLYYGDNLELLCQHVKDETLDLVDSPSACPRLVGR